MKTNLEYWSPINKTVVTETGFRYLNTDSELKKLVSVEFNSERELFILFYKKNNSLRYCNGTYYQFEDKKYERRYHEWLKSDDYEKISFQLYYGNGIVD